MVSTALSPINRNIVRVVVLCLVCLVMRHAGVRAAGQGAIMSEMNMEFDFDPGFWDVGLPVYGDYFWNYSEMTFDFFARNDACDIDAFMVLERNKKGSVAAYAGSEKDFYESQGVPSKMTFEYWPGETDNRVVGVNRVAGPGNEVGVMHSRMSAMEDTSYLNTFYTIINSHNLLTFVISAPQESWDDSECAGGIQDLLDTFRVNGEPDPREKGIAEYFFGADAPEPRDPDTDGGHPAPRAGGSCPGGAVERILDRLQTLAEQARGDEDPAETFESLINEINALRDALGCEGDTAGDTQVRVQRNEEIVTVNRHSGPPLDDFSQGDCVVFDAPFKNGMSVHVTAKVTAVDSEDSLTAWIVSAESDRLGRDIAGDADLDKEFPGGSGNTLPRGANESIPLAPAACP